MARRLGLGAAGLVIVVALLAPAGASADTAPKITKRPAITGIPRDGELLTATAAWKGDPTPTAAWAWLRCDKAKTTRCSAITGAKAATYRVTAADVGSVLRVRLTVTSEDESAEAQSPPTSVVAAAPPPPPPPPDEPPGDLPPPTPPDSPVPVVVPVPAAVAPLQATPLLRPFPTVRIRGRLTLRGAEVTLLVVRSPRGALISARCRGTGCPVHRVHRTALPRTRLSSFQRVLRAGTRLDITVTRAGYIGKWTTIIIRRGSAPWRADRCVKPGRSRPSACPAA
jgi:hypothetical protein